MNNFDELDKLIRVEPAASIFVKQYNESGFCGKRIEFKKRNNRMTTKEILSCNHEDDINVFKKKLKVLLRQFTPNWRRNKATILIIHIMNYVIMNFHFFICCSNSYRILLKIMERKYEEFTECLGVCFAERYRVLKNHTAFIPPVADFDFELSPRSSYIN